jgi:hypothetical protein
MSNFKESESLFLLFGQTLIRRSNALLPRAPIEPIASGAPAQSNLKRDASKFELGNLNGIFRQP